jgi:hypothetical protein
VKRVATDNEDRMGMLYERVMVGELAMRNEEVRGWGFEGGARLLIFTARKPQGEGKLGRCLKWKNRIRPGVVG